MNSQQFEGNCDQLRIVIQTRTRNVPCVTSEQMAKFHRQTQARVRWTSTTYPVIGRTRTKARAKKEQSEIPPTDKECYTCGKKAQFVRDCWSLPPTEGNSERQSLRLTGTPRPARFRVEPTLRYGSCAGQLSARDGRDFDATLKKQTKVSKKF